jgi:MerR family transcriptional regulator, thiopeptide resistance regulator
VGEWLIKDVARLAGVTTRTLRHYDQTGLLRPARVGANGYRYYGPAELLRLQQILLLRMLGLDLGGIGEVLDGRQDELEALRVHHRRLLDERDRFDRLARTVALTLKKLHRGEPFTAESLFDGFVTESREEVRRIMTERYGDGVGRHFDEAEHRTASWDESDYVAHRERWASAEDGLLSLLVLGSSPDADDVLDAVAGHHAVVSELWTPTKSSYKGFAQHYLDDDAERERLAAQHPDFPTFRRDAMVAYADRRL